MKLRLKVFRYDPATGKEGYDTFELRCEEGMTFLSALQKIKEEMDPTLTFRHFCRAGICGTCTVYINSFPKLACREQVLPYALTGKEVVLEPLDKFPVIKDLAVDHDSVILKLKEFRSWIQDFKGDVRIPPEISLRVEKAADCILCSACQSYCPQVLEEDYAGPLIFAKIYRFLEDPRETCKDIRLTDAVREGRLYHCLSCNKCNNVCPKEVEPATLIRELMTYIRGDGEENS
ncbi:MAG: succinate dehydrogenase/fumarate reductase iron-sulfur subunit [Aquificota bacterium]|nr:succinate dehydrogenase/fumarate reductase iron-sulfur subunit [Aquificota bacterium]